MKTDRELEKDRERERERERERRTEREKEREREREEQSDRTVVKNVIEKAECLSQEKGKFINSPLPLFTNLKQQQQQQKSPEMASFFAAL